MFDKIEQKVHEVRRQPEYIRVRWMWGSVIVSMLFVIFIWMMSMRINFLQINSDTKTKESISDIQNQINYITTSPRQDDSVSIDELLDSGALDNKM